MAMNDFSAQSVIFAIKYGRQSTESQLKANIQV